MTTQGIAGSLSFINSNLKQGMGGSIYFSFANRLTQGIGGNVSFINQDKTKEGLCGHRYFKRIVNTNDCSVGDYEGCC